jgi:hypothetical protein
MYGHHILNYSCFLKVYLISFKLHIINYLKNSTNIENLEHMEYICDKIILFRKFENLNIYFKTKVVDGILG